MDGLGPSGTIGRILLLGLVGSLSLAAYLGVALLLKVEELRPALALLRQRGAKDES